MRGEYVVVVTVDEKDIVRCAEALAREWGGVVEAEIEEAKRRDERAARATYLPVGVIECSSSGKLVNEAWEITIRWVDPPDRVALWDGRVVEVPKLEPPRRINCRSTMPPTRGRRIW